MEVGNESLGNAGKEKQEELFGSDSEDGAGENAKMVEAEEAVSASASKDKDDGLDGLFGSDDEDVTAKTEVRTQSELSLPRVDKTIPSAGFAVACTMPSFVKIQPRPYVSGAISEEDEERKFKGAIGMVRWRYKRDESGEIVCDANGIPVRESNARMVKWSDGSYQYIVGSTVFNAELVPMHDRYYYYLWSTHKIH